MIDDKGLYSRALESLRVKFLPLQQGKTFTMDDVYRFFLEKMFNKDGAVAYKKALGDAVYNITRVNKEPELEQDGKHYRLIDRQIKEIILRKDGVRQLLDLRYPYGVEDTTEFGFEESVKLYPGDIIVVAGEGQRGKTAFCLNLAVNNMEKHKEIYFTSEFHEEKFLDRIANFNWVDVWKPDGQLKFTLAELEENYIDKIQYGCINILDWVRLDEEQWKINAIMKKMQDKLAGKGLGVIAMQKRSFKQVAVGGEGSLDYASLYLSISYDEEAKRNKLKVLKCKTPGVGDPNYKKYSFILIGGAKFHDIREEL